MDTTNSRPWVNQVSNGRHKTTMRVQMYTIKHLGKNLGMRAWGSCQRLATSNWGNILMIMLKWWYNNTQVSSTCKVRHLWSRADHSLSVSSWFWWISRLSSKMALVAMVFCADSEAVKMTTQAQDRILLINQLIKIRNQVIDKMKEISYHQLDPLELMKTMTSPWHQLWNKLKINKYKRRVIFKSNKWIVLKMKPVSTEAMRHPEKGFEKDTITDEFQIKKV